MTIDPVVSTPVDRDKIRDCHVSSYYHGDNFYNSHLLKTGRVDGSTLRSYMKFELPSYQPCGPDDHIRMALADKICRQRQCRQIYRCAQGDRQLGPQDTDMGQQTGGMMDRSSTMPSTRQMRQTSRALTSQTW